MYTKQQTFDTVIEDIPVLNAQQIFDKVVSHLRTQNAKAFDVGGMCSYRNEKGQKCAAGALILDQFYSAKLEGSSVTGFWGSRIKEALKLSGIPIEDENILNLVTDLQECHDCVEVQDWEFRLEDIANSNGLIYTPPTKEN